MAAGFYVYLYLTEEGSPYYVGKGSGKRMHVKHKVEVPPVERRVVVKDGLTNEEAKELEKELITKYGRKVDGGILDNIKINQWACFTGWKHSEEAKRKIKEGNTGLKRTPEQLKNYKGTVTEEHKEKIRQANLGKVVSDETKQKISQKLTGRKLSPETIAKYKARKLSPETIAKRQAAYRITIEARRAARLQEKNNG